MVETYTEELAFGRYLSGIGTEGTNVRRIIRTSTPPAWLPSGAIGGVDFTIGKAYFGGRSLVLADVLGGAYDPTAVSGAGMAVLRVNTNRPEARGSLMTALSQTFLMVCDFNNTVAVVTGASHPPATYREFLIISQGPVASATNYFDGAINGQPPYHGGLAATLQTGFGVGAESAPIPTGNVRVAIQMTLNSGTINAANGVSANGNDGVPQPQSGTFDHANIGWLPGWAGDADLAADLTYKTMIFYPTGKTVAQVEALSI